MRLFLSCTELGLGHVNRIIPLGKRLQARGHDLHFFSGGTAYQLLRKEFENVHQCTPVAWYENAHGIIASASVLNILLPIPTYDYDRNKLKIKSSSAAETIHRYYDLRRHMRKIRPDLIVSDGDMHALRLAHRWKIPSLYVTNIIRPSHSFSPLLLPGERFTERYVKKCNKIIVPDNPEPYTISQYNIGNLDELKMKHKVEFVGTFSDMTPIKGAEEHIFAPISGPLGTKAELTRIIVPVLTRLKTKSVISLGEPQTKAVKKRGNCEIHTWLNKEQRNQFMKNAKIVIFSGGHGTCFEVIKHMKTSICIPTQPEQKANARKLRELGCAISIEDPRELESAIIEMEENKQSYETSLKKVNEYSSKLKGLERTVDTIEQLKV